MAVVPTLGGIPESQNPVPTKEVNSQPQPKDFPRAVSPDLTAPLSVSHSHGQWLLWAFLPHLRDTVAQKGKTAGTLSVS